MSDKETASAPTDSSALYMAVIGCPHEITSDRIILRRDPSQPGENALAQLASRLESAARSAEKQKTPLTALQKKVLEHYFDGEYAHLDHLEESEDCDDTLVKFLLYEAHDAKGDKGEFSRTLDSAINQLRELQSAIENDAEAESSSITRYAMICPTICQGLVINSRHDIFLTEVDANGELKAHRDALMAAGMGDDGEFVSKVIVHEDSSISLEDGTVVTLIDADEDEPKSIQRGDRP